MATTRDVLTKISAKEQDYQANTVSYPANTSAYDLPHITVIEVFKYNKLNILSTEKKNKQGTVILPLASNLNYAIS